MIASLNLNPIDLLTKLFSWTLESLHTVFSGVPVLQTIGAFGLAVIILTLALRTLLFPIFAWQLRTTRRMQTETAKIQPELTELRRKYKGQPQKLTQEMQKLYREHGISPTGSVQGCIPVLLQLPIIWALYNSIREVSSGIHSDLGFLWVTNVTQTAREACCLVAKTGNTEQWSGWISGLAGHPQVMILPLIAAAATWAQSKMMLPPLPDNATAQQQSMQNVSKTMTTVMPISIVFFAINFAQGIALYWVTQSLYMIVQQYYLVGWGGINVPAWVPGAHRETHLTYELHRRRSRVEPIQPPRTTDTATGGIGVVDGNGNNSPVNSAGTDAAPRTKVMGTPSGSPSRLGKGGSRRRQR